MYKQGKGFGENAPIVEIKRLSDGACIPLDPANTDYQNFRKEVANGAELQDSDGNVMTQEQVNQFLETIPQ